MAASNQECHRLFHEAQRRVSGPQPVMKHRKAKSLLLPAPNNIIFELFNTIIKEIGTEIIFDYVTKNLKAYLESSWASKLTQQCIKRLRREQAIDIRAGLLEAPLIKFSTGALTARPTTTIFDCKSIEQQQKRQQQQQTQTACVTINTTNNNNNARPVGSPVRATQKSPPLADREPPAGRQAVIEQIYEHIMWRVQTDNVTQITSLLIKLLLDDGYKRGKLKAEAYEDVAECFNEWRAQKLIKLYAFGVAPANDQKLILRSTTSGDLTKWIANYLDGTEKRQKPDLIRVLASTLRDKTKNCIFITSELPDAMNSLETGAIRCAFLVDRRNHYEPIQSMPHFSAQIEPLITGGKLFVMSSLSCVEFAPDPNSDACC